MKTVTFFEKGDRFTTIDEADGMTREWIVDYTGEPRRYEECPFTQSHTRYFCGYPQCRES